MTAKIINGKEVADHVRKKVAEAVKRIKENNVEPCLATVLVGDNPASATYVGMKQRACVEVGIRTIDHHAPQSYTTQELVELITILNEDRKVHGILVQLPLPDQITEFVVTGMIDVKKDVDGLTPTNAGLLAYDLAMLKPCTPAGIMELLKYYDISVNGKHAVVINRSMLVGKPISLMLLHQDATVTICHSKTLNIKGICKEADLLVTAVGNREKFVITPDMIKDDAVVIDVATSRVNGKLVGDVDFESVKEKASYITPVPGGVGPMTVAMLLRNTVLATSLSEGIQIDV
ncbi:MAG: bifunctional 5,10-methylenetetrahydrofolate dehydrogenase/5,10-methenyltetrahydrofolate cyclohydrolase [Nitrososphaerales archaeon]